MESLSFISNHVYSTEGVLSVTWSFIWASVAAGFAGLWVLGIVLNRLSKKK